MKNSAVLLFLVSLLVNIPNLLSAQEGEKNPIEQCLSSVVTIALYELGENDAIFGFGDDERERESEIAYQKALDLSGSVSAGSGFVIEYKGQRYIVTNAHVLDGAAMGEDAIRVYNIGRERFPVRFVGGDSFYDIAVLAFEEADSEKRFTAIPFAKKPAGLTDKVFAIGNPLGKYPYTITDGIVSGKNRLFQNPTTGKYGFMQHTATLIWGNSGGPLVNSQGELVGVNSWIGTDVKNNQQFIFSQLNFAIESDLVQQLVGEIIDNNGRVRRNFTGIEFGTRRDYLDLDSPPFIQDIVSGSPASELMADKVGYYVTAINGEPTKTLQDILRIFERAAKEATFEFSLSEEMPDFSQTSKMAGFKKVEKVSVSASDMSIENLEKIANHFFDKYGDYQLKEENGGLHLRKKTGKPKARIEKVLIDDMQAKYVVEAGQDEYEVIGAGLFDNWGRGTLYRAKSLKDIGAVIRLCSMEGHLSMSVQREDDSIENIRFFLQDANFEELRVLYY